MVEAFKGFTLLFSSLSAKIALFQSVANQAQLIDPNCKIVGADSDIHCIGAKQIEHFVEMPYIKDLNQDILLKFCKENKIQFVIPTRDGELQFWAMHQEFLLENQIGVMISSSTAIALCEDKYALFNHLEYAPTPSIKTSLSMDTLASSCDRFVVKERIGSASRSIGLNLKKEEVEVHLSCLQDPIFQPQINGREFSAETWIDQEGKPHGIVLRWRISVVNGESHETKTFKNPDWTKKILETVGMIKGLKGHILAQVIVDENDCLHLVEINPRLGGASPLSLAAGLESINWSLLEFFGHSNQIPEYPIIKKGLHLSKQNLEINIR
ncbi:MAG: ATP-grasp domain-containing protein [Opitutales bacterium]